MTGTPQPSTPAVPSAARLAVTTAIALAVAVVILVTIVLPAEYGIDPLGTGERLGLTAMSRPASAPKAVTLPAGDEGLKPHPNGPQRQYGTPFKTDVMTFTLAPHDYIEYKYALGEGSEMQFAWKASADVNHEFHGERDANPDQVTSYDKSVRREANGAFTAPFGGVHGWFWENTGTEPVTITLKSSGFYAFSIEYRSDKTTVPHDLATP